MHLVNANTMYMKERYQSKFELGMSEFVQTFSDVFLFICFFSAFKSMSGFNFPKKQNQNSMMHFQWTRTNYKKQ